MLKNSTYKWPFVFALLLHGILFSFLFIEFITYHNYTETNKPQVNIIKATAVDQAQVEKQIADIKAKRERKHQEELARIHRLQEAKLAKIRREKALQKQKALAKVKKQQKLKTQIETKRREEIQKAMQQQIAEEKQQMAEHDRQIQAEIDKYKALIIQTISQHWIIPSDIAKNISCQLIVNVAPGGEILSVDLARSSGNSILDRSARSAVLKSSPLPVPRNAEIFDNFRQLMLTVRPEGIEG